MDYYNEAVFFLLCCSTLSLSFQIWVYYFNLNYTTLKNLVIVRLVKSKL